MNLESQVSHNKGVVGLQGSWVPRSLPERVLECRYVPPYLERQAERNIDGEKAQERKVND